MTRSSNVLTTWASLSLV